MASIMLQKEFLILYAVAAVGLSQLLLATDNAPYRDTVVGPGVCDDSSSRSQQLSLDCALSRGRAERILDLVTSVVSVIFYQHTTIESDTVLCFPHPTPWLQEGPSKRNQTES
jgi:hypothetical protein